MTIVVRVQTDDFDVGVELERLRAGRPGVGAIASFTGIVRDTNEVADREAEVDALTLEHYPGMTERALDAICAKACERWPLIDVTVIHRHGTLRPTDHIVFVAASSSQRQAAFAACDFIMDFLKTEAPFWKKESTPEGPRWVEARDSDHDAARRWVDAPVVPPR
jgi:molybdopterin synthase catalytic subunit